ncbi:hypothetical protein WK59_27250 [Burkholderia ubonensis]|nr:hypothetical protein WK59_27250 [Burkholderia ubonensis]
MSSKKMSGYWIVVVGLTVSAGILAYYTGDAIHPSRLVRILVVALAGALLLAMEGLVRGAWRWKGWFGVLGDGRHGPQLQKSGAGMDVIRLPVPAQRKPRPLLSPETRLRA